VDWLGIPEQSPSKGRTQFERQLSLIWDSRRLEANSRKYGLVTHCDTIGVFQENAEL
jgi:hypothetical protein